MPCLLVSCSTPVVSIPPPAFLPSSFSPAVPLLTSRSQPHHAQSSNCSRTNSSSTTRCAKHHYGKSSSALAKCSWARDLWPSSVDGRRRTERLDRTSKESSPTSCPFTGARFNTLLARSLARTRTHTRKTVSGPLAHGALRRNDSYLLAHNRRSTSSIRPAICDQQSTIGEAYRTPHTASPPCHDAPTPTHRLAYLYLRQRTWLTFAFFASFPCRLVALCLVALLPPPPEFGIFEYLSSCLLCTIDGGRWLASALSRSRLRVSNALYDAFHDYDLHLTTITIHDSRFTIYA